MASKSEKKGGEYKVDPNAWMTTFADLVMLLLTFFVLLLTMKSMDAGKVREIFVRTYGPLDYFSNDEYVEPLNEFDHYVKAAVITTSESLEKAFILLEGIDAIPDRKKPVVNLRNIIEITESEKGVVITLEADELFTSGEAEIHPERLEVLDAIGRLFRYAANDILVMGHTDNVPVSDDRFASNWELSAYRALNVLYYLTDSLELRADRLAAGGFGAMSPRYANDSPENRAKNRRVEFILKRPV
jgi:chemotaxis protein MotB